MLYTLNLYSVHLTQSCPTLWDPMDCSTPDPLSMGFSRQDYWNKLPCPLPGDLPNPGIETRSPALQVDSLLSESRGKPKNIGVDSLSLLRGIFLTQESNRGLLHCRQVLYQLSCLGSPNVYDAVCQLYLTKTGRIRENYEESRAFPYAPRPIFPLTNILH